MATDMIIAAADYTPKPSVTKDSWSPHLLAGAYANAAPEREEPLPYQPEVRWWSNRWLAEWERPFVEAGARLEYARECRVLAGVMAAETP